MKKFQTVLSGATLIPEQKYMVFTPTGCIAFNDGVGLKYSGEKIGPQITNLAKKHGSFAVVNGVHFLRVLGTLDQLKDIKIDKEDSMLILYFNESRGVTKIPITFTLPETIPHLQIPFLSWADTKKDAGAIPVDSAWDEFSKLLTKAGTTIWGDNVGLYGLHDKLIGFDYNIAMRKILKAPVADNFFCSLKLLKLDPDVIRFARVLDDSSILLVGDGLQYYSSEVGEPELTEANSKFIDSTKGGTEFGVSLQFKNSLWRRIKVFARVTVTFEVKDRSLNIWHGSWREEIGKTNVSDMSFSVPATMLERWAKLCLDHKLIRLDNGEWVLSGVTRSGIEFYGSLTDHDGLSEFVEDEADDDSEISPEAETSAEEDVGDGAALI